MTNNSPKYQNRKSRHLAKPLHNKNKQYKNLNLISINSKRHTTLSFPKCPLHGKISNKKTMINDILTQQILEFLHLNQLYLAKFGQNLKSVIVMGCCFTKKKDKQKEVKVKATASMQQEKVEGESSQSKDKIQLVPEHAKMWLQQRENPSEKQPIEEQKQNQQQNTTQPLSKRRQLLRNIFEQAKKTKNLNESPLTKLKKAQTMDSNDSFSSQKSRLTTSLEQALRQLIKNNKQQLTSCGICTEIYSDSRPPMMVCMNQHSFCLQCIQDLWNKGYQKCPLDQNTFDINKIQKNRLILQIANKLQVQK